MSQDRSRDIVQALAVPDPRMVDATAIWDAETTAVPAGARAGRAVDQGDSDLVLAAYGARDDDDIIEVVTVKGGGIDPISGAGFAWREDGDALYRGQQAPTSIWGWLPVQYVDGSGVGVLTTDDPHSLTTATGRILVAHQRRHSVLGYGVSVARFDEGDTAFTATSVFTQTAAPSNDFHPCLYAVPRDGGERIHLLTWVENATLGTLQVRMDYSDDDGATWTRGSTGALDVPLYTDEVEGLRLRAAYGNGQVVLFAHVVGQDPADAALVNDHIIQWASIDNGASFRLVANGQGSETTEGGYCDVVHVGGSFLLGHISQQSTTTAGEPYVVIRRIPDAFASFATTPRIVSYDVATTYSATSGGYLQVSMGDAGGGEVRHVPAVANYTFSKGTYVDGDLSLAVAESGVVYMVLQTVEEWEDSAGSARGTNAERSLVVVRSVDGGQNWETMGSSDLFERDDPLGGFRPSPKFPGSNVLFRSGDDSSYLENVAATWWRGRLIVAHQWSANPGNEDESTCVLAAGGYQTVNLPALGIERTEVNASGWQHTWLPIERPGDLTPWTAFGAGTDALDDGALNIACTSQQRNFTASGFATDQERGYIARASLTVVDATSLTSSRLGFQLTAAVTGFSYAVEVRFSETAFRVVDLFAGGGSGAPVGSDVTIDTTAGVDLVVAMQDGEVAVWYRSRSLTDDAEYIAGPAGSITDGGGGSTDEVKWGVLGSDTAEVDWHEFHVAYGESNGSDVEYMADMANPGDLFPIRYSSTGTYITDGVSILARSGPTLEGDEHHIGVAYDFPLSRILPGVFPSPRRGTRCGDTTTEQIVALSFDPTLLGAVESAPLSPAQALVLRGINFRTAHLEGYDVGTSAWVSITSIDAATGLTWAAGGWARYGNTIVATGTGLGPYTSTYTAPDEFAGNTLSLNGTLRRIRTNSAGITDGKLNGQKTRITFEDGDNTESTASVQVWATDLVVWWNNLGNRYAGLRLRIPAQSTVDGDFRIGSMMVCNLHPLGTPYSFGRAMGLEHGVQVVEAEDRTYRTRELAPTRRTVTIDWQDGVPTCDIYGTSPDPDYLMLSTSPGAEPVALAFDVPELITGLAEQTNGPTLPMVYLPSVAKGPPDATVLNRRRDFIVGVSDGEVRLDTVRGRENSSEWIRVQSMTMVEVV